MNKSIGNLQINAEFEKALNIINNTSENLFIEGRAGTGKTTFIEYVKNNYKGNVVVVAPTGAAAVNVKGQTIHSFFKFRIGFIDVENDIKATRDIGLKKMFQKVDLLIIDEISMVRPDLFSAIEKMLYLNGKVSGWPFGGVQVCVVGDMKQLPPIVQQGDPLFQFYKGKFFNNCDAFKKADFVKVDFTEVYRQADNDFISILNQVREGEVPAESLNILNSRLVNPSHAEELKDVVVLTPYRKKADDLNEQKLSELKGIQYDFVAKITGDAEKMKNNFPAPEKLYLKEGALVMFVKNNKEKGWVNGTTGIVKKIYDNQIVVDVNGREKLVVREVWDHIVYTYNEELNKVEEKVLGKYEQFPLMLAWAITIHKSQGKTLEKVVIDLGRGAFEKGQTYVALSRSKTLDGIYLQNKLRHSDF